MRWIAFLLAASASAQTSPAVQAQLASVARQREAIRRQTATAPRAANRDVATAVACDALTEADAMPFVEEAAKTQQLPSKLVRAVIARESGFRPCAESKRGAKGLMQLMPLTAGELQVSEPFDAGENVAAGAKYLRQLVERYKGDLRLALAAYNAGPSTVDAAGGVPDIPETRDYVEAIIGMTGIKRIDLPSIPTPKPIGN